MLIETCIMSCFHVTCLFRAKLHTCERFFGNNTNNYETEGNIWFYWTEMVYIYLICLLCRNPWQYCFISGLHWLLFKRKIVKTFIKSYNFIFYRRLIGHTLLNLPVYSLKKLKGFNWWFYLHVYASILTYCRFFKNVETLATGRFFGLIMGSEFDVEIYRVNFQNSILLDLSLVLKSHLVDI